MKTKFKNLFKQFLTVVGARLSSTSLHRFQLVLNYMKLGRWMVKNNFSIKQRVSDRNKVFAAVADQVRDKHVLYLEFGVFTGANMRYWSQALRNPEAILHGFDSFEGLPEEFDEVYPKGAFNVQGKIPQVDDDRVKFSKDGLKTHYQLTNYLITKLLS